MQIIILIFAESKCSWSCSNSNKSWTMLGRSIPSHMSSVRSRGWTMRGRSILSHMSSVRSRGWTMRGRSIPSHMSSVRSRGWTMRGRSIPSHMSSGWTSIAPRWVSMGLLQDYRMSLLCSRWAVTTLGWASMAPAELPQLIGELP